MECRPDIIHISVPVSYVMIYSKLNKNKTWVMKNLAICVEYALEHGYEVTVGFEDASRADITFMIILAQQLKQRGVSRIRFADTVGILSPARTYQAVKDIMDNSGIEVEIHAHNDLGMAVANSVMGAKAGADYIDTTVSGIGERAGNCDFYNLIHTARDIFSLNITGSEAFHVQTTIAETLSIPPAYRFINDTIRLPM
jgi:homocitrate synthase NifV